MIRHKRAKPTSCSTSSSISEQQTTWALGVEYDGSAFHGWQRQSYASSAQQSLEEALTNIAAAPVKVVAAGRTDSGVHATAQVASFATDVVRPEKAWRLGSNSHLPKGLSVAWARAVPTNFHARFSALSRRYLYVYAEESPQALGRSQWWSGPTLDDHAMHRAAQALLGEQDFSAVRAAGCQSPTAWRNVHRISVSRYGDLVVLDIEANAFLLHMVRNTASMLAQVGRSERPASWVSDLLLGRDRSLLGPTAPPQALYLAHVSYPPELGLPGGRLPPVLRALGGFEALY